MTSTSSLPSSDGTAIGDLYLVGFSDDNTTYSYIRLDTPQGASPARNGSIWTSSGVEQGLRLLALEGETLLSPGEEKVLNEDIRAFSVNSSNMATDERIVLLVGSDNDNDQNLATGPSRQIQPYETFALPGASQLQYIAGENEGTVPGFNATSSFNDISDVQMNNQGKIWFYGTAVDNNGTAKPFTGIWRVNPGNTPMIALSASDPLIVNGGETTIRSLNSYLTNSLGQVLASVRTLQGRDYLVLIGATE